MKNKYVHDEEVHNLSDPREIVPEILKLLSPTSVVDIGCGLGTFLYCFKQNGITDVLGIDGSWVNRDLLYKYLSPKEFREEDLEKDIHLEKKYDLAISLEVAEHISEDASEIFVKNLVLAGKVVLFSAAIPFQGGQNHVNEQCLTYWEEKFLKHNYILHDVVRPRIWDNQNILWWYRQNMVIFAPPDFTFDPSVIYNPIRNIVHYELFNLINRSSQDVVNGKLASFTYLKYFLKSLLGSENVRKIKSLSPKPRF